MVQIPAGLIIYLLPSIDCHKHFQEKVSLRRVRQPHTQIENVLRCRPAGGGQQEYEKEQYIQNVEAKLNRELFSIGDFKVIL
jgi:hypothetical protein